MDNNNIENHNCGKENTLLINLPKPDFSSIKSSRSNSQWIPPAQTPKFALAKKPISLIRVSLPHE